MLDRDSILCVISINNTYAVLPVFRHRDHALVFVIGIFYAVSVSVYGRLQLSAVVVQREELPLANACFPEIPVAVIGKPDFGMLVRRLIPISDFFQGTVRVIEKAVDTARRPIPP